MTCGPEDIEDRYCIKGNRRIIKFCSRRKSQDILKKKKELQKYREQEI